MKNYQNEELLEIKQLPDPDNPQAIVVVTTKENEIVRQGIGAAIKAPDQMYDPQALIDQASARARERAKGVQSVFTGEQVISRSHSEAPRQNGEVRFATGQTREHNPQAGSISEKQLAALGKMSRERSLSLDTLAQNKFGVRPEKMSSREANELMQVLRSNRGSVRGL